MSSAEGTAKVTGIISSAKLAMLTTVDGDGHLVSRPMAVQQVEDDGDLWFFSDGDARKVHQVEHGSPVNVALSSGGSWVSVAGTAEVVVDPQKARELWNAGAEAWFPDGPDTPGLVLLRVRSETAEYWDTPGSRVSTLLSYAKSRVTGRRPDVGENEVVEL